MRNTKKGALLLALAGTTLFGGCLGGFNLKQIVLPAAVYFGAEFLTDNNGVFDLFDAGSTEAAAQP